jgi:(p)ppGpp synthase/HD superfamily hydrolase
LARSELAAAPSRHRQIDLTGEVDIYTSIFREAVDAGQDEASIARRYGQRVGRIVADCTDTAGPVAPGAKKEPWLLRKTRYVASLEYKPLDSLLVTAADKAHNARDMVLDARRDPISWERFNAGIDATAWYLLRIHQTLSHRLPYSRSNELLGEAVSEILASDAYRRLVPAGLAPEVWAAGYLERPETHRSRSTAGVSTSIEP